MMLLKEVIPGCTPNVEAKEFKLSSLNLKYRKLFYQAYPRELKALYFYRKFLSKINNSELREILMDHIHQLKSYIHEMTQKGVNKYRI